MKIYEKYKNDFDFDLNKKKPNDFLTLNTPLGKIYLYQEEMGYIEVY